MDLSGTIETEIAKELVKAMISGLVDLVKKVPALFGRSGKAKSELVAAEVDRSIARLASAEDDPVQERIRQEAVWEVLLRELLIEQPEATQELLAIVAEIHRSLARRHQSDVYEQRVEGSGIGVQGPGAIVTVNHNYTGGTASSREQGTAGGQQ